MWENLSKELQVKIKKYLMDIIFHFIPHQLRYPAE
jgi:hypothetical protein